MHVSNLNTSQSHKKTKPTSEPNTPQNELHPESEHISDTNTFDRRFKCAAPNQMPLSKKHQPNLTPLRHVRTCHNPNLHSAGPSTSQSRMHHLTALRNKHNSNITHLRHKWIANLSIAQTQTRYNQTHQSLKSNTHQNQTHYKPTHCSEQNMSRSLTRVRNKHILKLNTHRTKVVDASQVLWVRSSLSECALQEHN